MGLYTSSGIFSGTSNSGKNGGIIQTKYTAVTNVVTASGNGINLSDFATSITPTSSNSSIIIMVSFGAVSGNNNTQTFEVRRNGGSVNAMRGDGAGSRNRRTFRGCKRSSADNNHTWGLSMTVQDFPSTTSSVTYNIYTHPESNGVTYINRSHNDENGSNNYQVRTMSTLLLMEVGDT